MREREDSRSLSYSPLHSLLSSPYSYSFLFHPPSLSHLLPLLFHPVPSRLSSYNFHFVFSLPSRPFPPVSVPISISLRAADSIFQCSEYMIIATLLPVPPSPERDLPLPRWNYGTGSISGIKSKTFSRIQICDPFWNRGLSSPLRKSLPGPASCCPCSSAL
jgi:hypothetical protein